MSHFVTRYQSANLTDRQVIDNFVVRTKEFERVMAEVRTTKTGNSFQHYVFVGRRGSGKSTLLRRIQAEIAEDKELKKQFIVVNLSEEQAGIYKLHDLWDYAIRGLQAEGAEIQEVDWQTYEDDLKEYSKALYASIHALLKKEKKRLILLIDNIDRIFKNIGEDADLLREQLMNHNQVWIIGGSTIMSEAFWRYDMPFYQFFSIKRLEPLTLEEIKTLLEHWAKVRGIPDIASFIERHPGKIQAVRMLTDGTPRTMQMFVDMLTDSPSEQGFDYLRRIIDHATPVYQERLLQLSTQQQKIVVELSFFWEAASVSQLIPVCKMSSKNISAQMSQLVKLRIAEKLKGQGKNMLYRLEERFFNLWLLMTQGGPKEKRSAKYLTHFLEAWYDDADFKNVFIEFFQNLQAKEMAADYIVAMTKAFAQSTRLGHGDRDLLLETVNAKKGIPKDLLDQLPKPSKEKVEEILSLYIQGKINEVVVIAETIQNPARELQLIFGDCFFKVKNWTKAIENYEKGLLKYVDLRKSAKLQPFRIEEETSARKLNDERLVVSESLFNLSYCKMQLESFEETIQLLEESVNLGNPTGLSILAKLLYYFNRNSDTASQRIEEHVRINPKDKNGLVTQM